MSAKFDRNSSSRKEQFHRHKPVDYKQRAESRHALSVTTFFWIYFDTRAFAGLSGVAQICNCKIGRDDATHVLVADGASTRIDVETCAFRVLRSPRDAYIESFRSCFPLVSSHPAPRLSDSLKSLFWCDQISFSNPLAHNLKRRMCAGSIISLCDITETFDGISNSFIEYFPHLPHPAAAAAEINKEVLDPDLFLIENATHTNHLDNKKIGVYE